MSTLGSPTDPLYDHLVVGGGLTGLAYAWRRLQEGRSVAVIDAMSSAGGTLADRPHDDLDDEPFPLVVTGAAPHAEALLAAVPGAPALPSLSHALPVALWRRTGLVGLPHEGARGLGTSAAGWSAALRALRPSGPRPTRETLAAFSERLLGARILHDVVRPFTRLALGAPPEVLGAADAWPALVAAAERRLGTLACLRETLNHWRLPAGGARALIRALVAALGDRVHLVRRAASLTKTEADPREIRILTTDGESWRAREVALAVPPGEQAGLLRELAPHRADVLDAIDPVGLASVAVRVRAKTVPRLGGFLPHPAAGARLLGAVFTSRLDPTRAEAGRALIHAWFGGRDDEDALDLGDDLLARIAILDLERALGGRLEPQVVGVGRHRCALPLLTPGYRERLATLSAALLPQGLRLLGEHVVGIDWDARCRVGAPSRCPLPPGAVLA